jgi:hypothetical protein
LSGQTQTFLSACNCLFGQVKITGKTEAMRKEKDLYAFVIAILSCVVKANLPYLKG